VFLEPGGHHISGNRPRYPVEGDLTATDRISNPSPKIYLAPAMNSRTSCASIRLDSLFRYIGSFGHFSHAWNAARSFRSCSSKTAAVGRRCLRPPIARSRSGSLSSVPCGLVARLSIKLFIVMRGSPRCLSVASCGCDALVRMGCWCLAIGHSSDVCMRPLEGSSAGFIGAWCWGNWARGQWCLCDRLMCSGSGRDHRSHG
jgi:hypothetical protein